MRTILSFFLALLCFSHLAEAQIVVVHFKDERAAKRYKKVYTEFNDELVILGEPVEGGGIVIEGNSIQYRNPSDPRSPADNQLFLLDPKNPEKVPYELKDGVKEASKKKAVVNVAGADIGRLEILMRGEDIASLAKEYRFRLARAERAADARDSEDKGTVPWFTQHRLMLVEYERLVHWLESLSFKDAAKKLQKKIAKERKVKTEEGVGARWKTASDSLQQVEPFEELVTAAEEITNGAHKFHVMESQHLRIIYLTDISDARVKRLLSFGEQLIEGFRVEFVDPYRDDDFEDYIPDDLCVEWFFGPDSFEAHRGFLEEYYGTRVGNPELLRESAGMNYTRALPPQQVFTWKYNAQRDLEGIVTHNLGHALALLHFNGGPNNNQMPFLEEGLGYYLSFEYTGRNSVTCREIRPADYIKQKKKEGDKTVMLGLRDLYNTMALEKGPRLDKMALKYLQEFEDADLAKSWSVFDWAAKELGKPGQLWLRAGAQAARNRATFLAEWRTASEEIFGIQGKDVFRHIDDLWKQFARTQQDTSENFRSGKKKRR